MKKIKLLCLLLMSIFLMSACSFKDNNLEDAKIYTTIYPVEYIAEYLYGENSTIESIYPIGVNLNNYTLTEKQIDNYAQSDLFVYIGLGNEKEIAKSFINKNEKLLIIDATYGLSYNNNLIELWLAPNNFLMLAKNIKNSLNEYLDNAIKEENVNKKYDELYENVSWVDAELRNIARDSKENGDNTLVVSSNVFKFLDSYGFNVISLEDIKASGSENAINDIKSKFKDSKYTDIIKLNSEENTELMNELKTKYKATIHDMNDIVTNSDSASDYVSIQYENIAIIRDILK
ncbi:MAG: zinc ABC transporter substrate-binding protein [Firmicutes bacterium]|nr:zinc ABC transporter substrate-binding protein [Bacillota bacterium]